MPNTAPLLPAVNDTVSGYDPTWGVDRTGTVLAAFVVKLGPYRGKVAADIVEGAHTARVILGV